MTTQEYLEIFISPVFTTIICSLLLVFANGMKPPKGELSLFSNSKAKTKKGRTILVHSFNRAKPRNANTAIELRPRWGFSVFTPLLAYLGLTSVSWGDIWAFIGVSDEKIITLFTIGALLPLAYIWIWQTFLHKVVYDANSIMVADDMFRKHERNLSELEAIEIHSRRPVFELFFTDGKKLEVASNISHRASFVADMEAKIEENRTGARGNLQMVGQEIFSPDMPLPAFHATPTYVPVNPMAARDVENLPPELARF